MRLSLKRLVTGATACSLAAGSVSLLSASAGYADHKYAGVAAVVDPSTDAPLTSGGSATPFRFKLPDFSSCTGDSANNGYRIQSYIVPLSVDLDTLRFDDTGPVQTAGQFRAPHYEDGSGSQFSSVQTALQTSPNGPGQIIQPLPNFSYFVYTPPADGFPIPAGSYNVGIACTKGQPGDPDQLDKYWNNVMTLTTDLNDSPAQITWTVVPPPAATRRISGTVTEAGSGEPLQGICVYLHDTAGARTTDVGTCTNAQGAYTMPVANPGSYKVAFFDPGSAHVTQWFSNKPSSASATSVAVGSGPTTSINAAMVLTSPAVITGTITDAQGGAPLSGICVYLYNASTDARTSDAGTCSNAQGTYTLGVGAAGSYEVGFFDPAGARVTQWANGKPSQATADPVVVTAGRVTSGVNAAMVSVGSISGTVTQVGGGGYSGVCVYADDLSGAYTGLGACTGPDGRYTIAGFVPGSYKLGFYLPGDPQGPGAPPTNRWYDNKSSEATADPVAVNPGSTTSGIDQTFPI